MSDEIRIVIAEDHPFFRDGLRNALQSEKGLRVVAEASDGRTALEYIRTLRPEVAILDEKSGQSAASSLSMSVLMGHQEARCRALQWLLTGPLADSPHADAVNLVRRRCERWTDLLIANMSHLGSVADFAFDVARTSEFTRDFADERKRGVYPAAWAATITSLRSALRVGLARESFSRDANRQISSAILACLGPDLFTTTGMLRSAWLTRIQRITSDTEGMLSELLSIEAPLEPWEGRISI